MSTPLARRPYAIKYIQSRSDYDHCTEEIAPLHRSFAASERASELHPVRKCSQIEVHLTDWNGQRPSLAIAVRG